MEDDLPHLEAEAVVEVAMMIHRHLTTMAPLRGNHVAAIPQPAVVEQGKSSGDQAFGVGHSVERRLVTWQAREINRGSKKLNKEAEDSSVAEPKIEGPAAGLVVVVTPERAARGLTILARQLRLQAGIRVQVSERRRDDEFNEIFVAWLMLGVLIRS